MSVKQGCCFSIHIHHKRKDVNMHKGPIPCYRKNTRVLIRECHQIAGMVRICEHIQNHLKPPLKTQQMILLEDTLMFQNVRIFVESTLAKKESHHFLCFKSHQQSAKCPSFIDSKSHQIPTIYSSKNTQSAKCHPIHKAQLSSYFNPFKHNHWSLHLCFHICSAFLIP